MAEELYEIVVRLRPEGVEETDEALESVGDKTEETAEDVEEAAGKLEKFADKWQGALTVITAGLFVATSALASQVPIISDLMDGLGAILESVALKIDDTFRPALQPLADLFFDIAEAIHETEGPLGTLIGLLGGLSIVLGTVVAPLALLLQRFGKLVPLLERAVPFFSRLITHGRGLAGAIAAIPGAVTAGAVAIGALIGLFGVGILETTGFMDKVEDLGRMIGEALPEWALEGMLVFSAAFTGAIAVIGAAIAGFVEGYLEGGLSAGIDQAVENAEEVLEIYKTAWENTVDRIETLIGEAVEYVTEQFTTVKDTLADAGSEILTSTKKWWNRVKNAIKDAINSAKNSVFSAVSAIKSRIASAINSLKNLARRAKNAGGGGGSRKSGGGGGSKSSGGGVVSRVTAGLKRFADRFSGFDTGGEVLASGLARVHEGEQIVPAQVDRGGGDERATGMNVFAERDEMIIRFEPRRFEQFMSAELNDGPANTGRSSGPQG